MKCVVVALCALTGAPTLAAAQALEPPPGDRAITVLRDDLYQVRDGQQHTVFLVTPDGIILGDPLSRNTAMWLRQELDARFPGRSVRFVLLSDHHVDRAEGAAVFTDTAEIVGNRAFDFELSASRRAMPDLYRFVRNVERTYDGRRTIKLGGQTVELISTEWIHSTDLTVINFPDQRFTFAAEAPQVTVVPFAFGPDRPGSVLKWIHAVDRLEFDTLLLGNGERVSHTELTALGEYLDALRRGVAAGYERGDNVAELQARLLLAEFAASPHYPARPLHIATIYRTLRLVRVELSGAAVAEHEGRNPRAYCATYTFCAAGGAVAAGTGSAAFLVGRSFGVVVELTFGDQSWSSRTRPLYEEEVVLRRAHGAILARYSPSRPRLGRLSYALLGGVSQTFGDVRGANYVPGAVVPVGGFHEISDQYSKLGLTFGLDLRHRLGAGLSIVVPIRATQLPGKPSNYQPGTIDVRMGVGISTQIFRRVD